MSGMYGPLRYFTEEMLKGMGDRAKEIMTFLYPPVTMYEEAGEIIIEADMPGFDKKDIKVRLDNQAISINAKRAIETKGTVFLDQRPEEISRRIKLPMQVDEEVDFSAKYSNGILLIKIPVKGIKTVKIE